MKAPRFVLMVVVLTAVAGCARQQAAENIAQAKASDPAQTHQYLQEVGRIRAKVNADNRERIPALIRGEDVAMLVDEASRMDRYKQDVARIAAVAVDPEAVEFSRHFGAIVDAYKAVCLDAAEIFREVAKDDASTPGSQALMPRLKEAMPVIQPDAIGATAALAGAVEQLDAAAKAHAVFLAPIVQKLRDDRQGLIAAKDAHHNFTVALKADFVKRYPAIDWSDKEVLPQQ